MSEQQREPAQATMGERIRRLRREARMSQRYLADRAGVSPAWVGQVERGDITSPGADVLEAVAGVLGVTVDALLTGRDATAPGRAEAATLGAGSGEVVWYPGYPLWGRDDPRLGAPGGDTRRVMVERGTHGGDPEDVFVVLVGDDELDAITTSAGRVKAGWRLFVDTRTAAGARAGTVVAAMSATGRLVVGELAEDTGSPGVWSVFTGKHREPVARDDVLGEVVEYQPATATLGRVRPA